MGRRLDEAGQFLTECWTDKSMGLAVYIMTCGVLVNVAGVGAVVVWLYRRLA